MPERELTRDERAAIRKLVVQMCANYDYKYGCLPLDYGRCYMLDKSDTGAYCRYFIESVLPNDPELETALTGKSNAAAFKTCAVCGVQFIPKGRKIYCSEVCRARGTREKERRKKRKQRRNRV